MRQQYRVHPRSKNPLYAYEAGRGHSALVPGFCTMTCSCLDQRNLISPSPTPHATAVAIICRLSHIPLLSAGDTRTFRSTIRTVSPHPGRAAVACHHGWHGRRQMLSLLCANFPPSASNQCCQFSDFVARSGEFLRFPSDKICP